PLHTNDKSSKNFPNLYQKRVKGLNINKYRFQSRFDYFFNKLFRIPYFCFKHKGGMLLKLKKSKKFSYIEEGDGIPIVLLHGLMGELSNFGSLMQHFSRKGYKVYAPELPIYSYPLLNTNVSSIAKFVARFLKEIVQEPAILVGNSLGGHLGLVVTHKHPELVKA